MTAYRVMWVDPQVGGRWTDVEATDEANATWQTALEAGQGTTFQAVAALTPPTQPTGD